MGLKKEARGGHSLSGHGPEGKSIFRYSRRPPPRLPPPERTLPPAEPPLRIPPPDGALRIPPPDGALRIPPPPPKPPPDGALRTLPPPNDGLERGAEPVMPPKLPPVLGPDREEPNPPPVARGVSLRPPPVDQAPREPPASLLGLVMEPA